MNRSEAVALFHFGNFSGLRHSRVWRLHPAMSNWCVSAPPPLPLKVKKLPAFSPHPLKTCAFLLFLAGPLPAGGSKDPIPASGDWEWTLSVGPSVRNVGEISAQAGYRSASLIMPSFVGGNSFTAPPIGDAGTYADRTYEDGFVRQDDGTRFDGRTWNWGYENNSQVQANELAFAATGFQSVLRNEFVSPATGPSNRDHLNGFAPHIQIDMRSPRQVAGFRLGFSGAFDFTHVDQRFTFSNFSVSQYRDDYRLEYEDRYELGEVIPPLAPYAGSLEGPGPFIANIPSSRSVTPVLVFTDTASIANQVRTSLDIDVFSFTFGPTFSRSFGSADFALQIGTIVNIYNWDGRQVEQLDATNSGGKTRVASWDEDDSGTKFRPGLYAQADVSYDVTENWQIGAFVRVDTAGDFHAAAGPTEFRIDPSGCTAGFMLRHPLP